VLNVAVNLKYIKNKLGREDRYMIESKGWNWKIVKDEKEEIWKNPSVESYYLLNRWKSQNKKYFLD